MAKKRPDTALYFTTVLAGHKTAGVLGGHLYSEKTEPTVTRIAKCDDGNWFDLGDLDDIVYSLATKPPTTAGGRPSLCMLGREGHYRELIPNRKTEEAVIDTTNSGFLLALSYIGNRLYACGQQNQVLRQEGKSWKKMDAGIYAPMGDEIDRSLNTIAGFSEDEIYAAGDDGKLFRWDGRAWSEDNDSPTNLAIYSLVCGSQGELYMGCAGGLIFRRTRAGAWRDLSDSSLTTENIEGLAAYRGSIYAAAHDVLLKIDGDHLSAVKIPIKGEHTFDAISANEDVLWAVGNESALVFDGKAWQKQLCPDNQ